MSVETVILAAGRSSRMGTFKMELPLGGKPLIVRTVEIYAPISDRIIVVGGYKIDLLRQLLAGTGVEVVENLDYDRGMFSSVQTGMAYARGEKIFITPGDCALAPKWVPRRMLAVVGEIVIPTYRGRGGHPLLIDKSVVPIILGEPPDSTLKKVITRMSACRIEVDTELILFDIDTEQDYQKARELYERGNFRPGSPG